MAICDEPMSCKGTGLFTTSPFPSGSSAIYACQCEAGRQFGLGGEAVGYTRGFMSTAYQARSEIKGWTGDELELRLGSGDVIEELIACGSSQRRTTDEKVATGGLWEETDWIVRLNVVISPPARCPHLKRLGKVERQYSTVFGDKADETEFFVAPRVIVAENEGGCNTTGVCFDCVLDEGIRRGLVAKK
jgi:hypothetical protein